MLSKKAPADLHRKHSWVPPNFLKTLWFPHFWREGNSNIYTAKSPRPTHQTIPIFCSSNPETRLIPGFSNCPESAIALLEGSMLLLQTLREQPQDQEAKERWKKSTTTLLKPSLTFPPPPPSFRDAVLNSSSLRQASKISRNRHPTASVSNLQGKGDSTRRARCSGDWSSLCVLWQNPPLPIFAFSPCSTQIWFSGHWYSPANYVSQAKLEKQLLLFHALRSSNETVQVKCSSEIM